MLTRKNAQAYAVLALIYWRLPEGLHLNYSIEPYMNFREEGFSITNYQAGIDTKVSFSEDRSTDKIVVYAGKHQDFYGSNVPSDAAFYTAQYFPPGAVNEAALYALACLNFKGVE